MFSACSGFDCFAAKGVVMASIKGVHIFATHMQSDAGGVGARREQAKTIADCIASLKLAKSAPILLLGDLNIDLLDVAELREFEQTVGMRRVLDDSMPTMDPHTNALVGHDNPSQWPVGCWADYRTTHSCACCPTTRLDHMLVRGDIAPIGSVRAVIPEVVPFEIQTDVGAIKLTSPSDHYPIVCSFKIGAARSDLRDASRMVRFAGPGWTAHDMWMWGVVIMLLVSVMVVIICICIFSKWTRTMV
jgi:endonuclease/exonuclease/phosphatase family metal-dependent hydrolase